MSTRIRLVTLSLVAATLFGAAPLRAQEEKPAAPPFDPAALEKVMEEYARVTDKHEGFKKLVGKWNTEMTCYMPGSPATASKGQATFRLLMGGRYLQQLFEGEMEGEKFQGLGICGYDNAQQKYVSVWIDSMSTGFMQSSGTLDEKTHVMTEIGESILPAPAGTMKMKIVTKPVDDNQFLFTMYTLTPDGGEQKMMEITYTRAAGAEQPKAAATKADK